MSETAVYRWASENELPAKVADRLEDSLEDLIRSAKSAVEVLEELIAKAEGDSPYQVLGSVIGFANLAGHSNSPATYVSKMYEAAGRFSGIVEATV